MSCEGSHSSKLHAKRFDSYDYSSCRRLLFSYAVSLFLAMQTVTGLRGPQAPFVMAMSVWHRFKLGGHCGNGLGLTCLFVW